MLLLALLVSLSDMLSSVYTNMTQIRAHGELHLPTSQAQLVIFHRTLTTNPLLSISISAAHGLALPASTTLWMHAQVHAKITLLTTRVHLMRRTGNSEALLFTRLVALEIAIMDEQFVQKKRMITLSRNCILWSYKRDGIRGCDKRFTRPLQEPTSQLYDFRDKRGKLCGEGC
jgi:hypothetical protein